MVDIHSHLLHRLDDGSPDLDTSIRMARMAVEDGITHMVCTPHASSDYAYSQATIASRLSELRSALKAEKIDLTLGSGCDFHLSYDNLQDALAHPRRYTLNGSEYLLIELPDHGIPPTLNNTFYELRLAGLTPILTHPERNLTLQRNTGLIANWLRNGMLVQVTANSVTGGMGKRAQQLALDLLANRWVHFLATDAHNLTSRPPILTEAYILVAKKFGIEYADLLCFTNPMAVFGGYALPPQQEALHLYDEEETGESPWWKRLLRID